MSRFLDKLERIWEGKAQPLGFGAQAKTKSPPMALVATLPLGRGDMVALAVAESVDAVLVPVEELAKEVEVLSQAIQTVGDIPLGVWVKTVTEEDVRQLSELGCDFLVFGADEVPATILVEGEIGKVLEIKPSLSDGLAKAIARLPIDAVLLKSEAQPLTVRRLMDYQRIASSVGKPSLSALPQGRGRDEVKGLWQAGIRGVVLSPEQLSQVREAIQALPLTKGRTKGKVDIFLPPISEEMGEIEEEI
jgi:hypothetical protein